MASQEQTWEQKVAIDRERCLNKIPKEWRLPEEYKVDETSTESVIDVPNTCGLLTPFELEVTGRYDAIALTKKLRAGEYKAVDVTTAFCKRAAIAQQLTNCLTETLFDEAIQRAKTLDEYLEKEGKPYGPLHGLPISVKDSFNVKHARTTLGYVANLDEPPATKNSALINILKDLGAVIFVKTNVPQALMGSDSHNHIFGRTLNPHNPSLTAGGSSGGEGALIALRGSLLGIGTDIGGSVRIPALCNGVYGFKPSSHRLPYAGVATSWAPGSPGFPGVAGPLATTFDDLELLTQSVIYAGPADYDAHALHVPWRHLPVTKTLRIGVVPADPAFPLHPPVKRALDTAERHLASAGHTLISLESQIPSLSAGAALAARSFTFDNSRAARAPLLASREPLVPHVAATTDLGADSIPEVSLADVYAWTTQREAYAQAWSDVFVANALDVLLAPVAHCVAPAHDVFSELPYTAAFNALEYPAIVIPYLRADRALDAAQAQGYDPDRAHGAPAAIQILARQYHDEEVVQAGRIVDHCLNMTPERYSTLWKQRRDAGEAEAGHRFAGADHGVRIADAGAVGAGVA